MGIPQVKLRSRGQISPCQSISGLSDASASCALAGLPNPRHESEVGTDVGVLSEPMGIIDSAKESQCSNRTNTRNFKEPPTNQVLFSSFPQFPVEIVDVSARRSAQR